MRESIYHQEVVSCTIWSGVQDIFTPPSNDIGRRMKDQKAAVVVRRLAN